MHTQSDDITRNFRKMAVVHMSINTQFLLTAPPSLRTVYDFVFRCGCMRAKHT